MVDFTKTQGRFLTDYVKEACETDIGIQKAIARGDGVSAGKMRRRIYRYAKIALEEQQRNSEIPKMTLAKFEERKKELSEPTKLVEHIKRKAAELAKSAKDNSYVADHTILQVEDLRDQDDLDLQETAIVVDSDLGNVNEGGEVTNQLVAKVFMTSLLEGFKIEYDQGFKCPECLADSTISAQWKVSEMRSSQEDI